MKHLETKSQRKAAKERDMGITIRGNGLKANTPGRMGKANFLKHVQAVPAPEPNGCTCYVAELDAETQFGLRWGAHGLECPRYRRSLDPVDDANDQDYRATHS